MKLVGININLEETKVSLKALYNQTKEPIYLELLNYYNGIKTVGVKVKEKVVKHKGQVKIF